MSAAIKKNDFIFKIEVITHLIFTSKFLIILLLFLKTFQFYSPIINSIINSIVILIRGSV
jgi:hypothetical protein